MDELIVTLLMEYFFILQAVLLLLLCLPDLWFITVTSSDGKKKNPHLKGTSGLKVLAEKHLLNYW